MFELNMSLVSLRDFGPAPQVLYCKNRLLMCRVLQHLTLAITCNSFILTEMISKAYLKPPSTNLMKRFDIDGTEVGTLQDPVISEVHYVALKQVYAHNLLLLFDHVHEKLPVDLLMSMSN